jgi:energy-coupling factor transporter ATP-binding protein EcfA2
MRCRVHGVVVESSLEMPDWPISRDGTPAETWRVEVDRGRVLDTDPIDRDLDRVRGTLTLTNDEAGERLVLTVTSPEDGAATTIMANLADRTIDVRSDIWVPASDAQLLLLLSARILPAIAALTRGSAALHATAVQIGGQAIAVCGRSGAGKSTLAAALIGAGGQLLGDEPVLVDASAGGAVAWPGVNSLRLGEGSDAIARLERLGWASVTGHDKVVVTPPPRPTSDLPLPLAAVLILGARLPGAALPTIVRLNPMSAVTALMRESYLTAGSVGTPGRRFSGAAPVVAGTSTFDVQLPDDVERLADSVAALLRAVVDI